MKFIIPKIPPTINKFIGRTNIWEYQKVKKEWRDLCTYLDKPARPFEKASVVITFYFKDKRRHDADNYQKFLLDGLVDAGIIIDDDFEHITVTCRGDYDRQEPRTEIEVVAI